MSFSFYVSSPAAPTARQILQRFPIPDVVCTEGDRLKLDKPWPRGYWHFYRDGLSTCAVEVCRQKGVFQFRIMAFAAPEDYELAIALAERAARVGKAKLVETEDGGALAPGELRKKYDGKWIAAKIAALFPVVAAMVRADKKTLQVPAAVRSFYIGPRLLEELEAAGPERKLTQRIIAAMRRSQYIEHDGYYVAERMHIQLTSKSDPFTAAAWVPGIRYVFPGVDYLTLADEANDGEPFFVPSAALPKIALERWQWLDEVQTLVEPFTEEEWPAVVKRARRHQVEPGQSGKRRRKS